FSILLIQRYVTHLKNSIEIGQDICALSTSLSHDHDNAEISQDNDTQASLTFLVHDYVDAIEIGQDICSSSTYSSHDYTNASNTGQENCAPLSHDHVNTSEIDQDNDTWASSMFPVHDYMHSDTVLSTVDSLHDNESEAVDSLYDNELEAVDSLYDNESEEADNLSNPLELIIDDSNKS
ncbi:2379_t:CDS:2, partial [Cetraspora pellucida]